MRLSTFCFLQVFPHPLESRIERPLLPSFDYEDVDMAGLQTHGRSPRSTRSCTQVQNSQRSRLPNHLIGGTLGHVLELDSQVSRAVSM